MSDKILYPPVHVFPRNPELAHWIDPERISETFKEGGSGLSFDIGPGGKRNIIKLTSSPYIDYTEYDFTSNTWDERPIIFKVDGIDITEQGDITNYFNREIVNFPKEAQSINDDISFYFDGEKLVTNYDFTNPDDRARVEIIYSKIVDTVRVKAVLMTTNPGESLRTPVVDQYTLIVGKQKVLN